MGTYDIYICTKQKRVKYPRNLQLRSIAAAHDIAVKIARVLIEARPSWDNLSIAAYGEFVVEIADETDKTVLAVPGRWVGSYLSQVQANQVAIV